MSTTIDRVSFKDFASIVRPHVKNRRLFLSACSMTNDRLAKLLMPGSDCYSIFGPDEDVAFNDASILWASLYHMMFAWDSASMTGAILRRRAQALADMYQVRLNYFGRDRTTKQGYVSKSIVPKDEPLT